VDIGAVLSEALALYQRFFTRFFLVALATFLVLGLVGIVESAVDGWFASLVWGLLGLVVTVVGTFWLQGTLVEAVRDVRDGRVDTTIGELYSRTRPRLPALIAAGVLAGIGIAIGFVLLIVPGLFLLTRWSMIVPVIVLEGRSAGDSFSRSAEVIKGNGWPVFGLIVVTLLGAGVVNGIIQALLSFLPGFLDTWLGSAVANSVVVPFVALSWTLAYFRLTAPAPESQSAAAAA
jgi:hypothetical protein